MQRVCCECAKRLLLLLDVAATRHAGVSQHDMWGAFATLRTARGSTTLAQTTHLQPCITHVAGPASLEYQQLRLPLPRKLTEREYASTASSLLPRACWPSRASTGTFARPTAARACLSTRQATQGAQQAQPQLTPERAGAAAVAPCFNDLGVAAELQERLAARDIGSALPVQAAAVPVILGGRNAAIKSCTGSGKTLAYLLPVLQLALERRRAAVAAAEAAARRGAADGSSGQAGSDQSGLRAAALKQRAKSLQALIVAPSRELCIQIQRTAQELLPAQPDTNRRLVAQLIGGASPKRQAEALAGGDGVWPLVVVGTPGRVAELVTNGTLHVWGCQLLVLDEVDQLLSHKDYRRQVDTICSHVGRKVACGGGGAAAAAALASENSATGSSVSAATDRRAATPAIDPSSEGSAARTGGGIQAGSPADTAPRLSGGGGGEGAPSRRQTVVVSASLDARNLGRYADWCPAPVPIVLGSSQALPRQHLQLPQPPGGEPLRPEEGDEMEAKAEGRDVEGALVSGGADAQRAADSDVSAPAGSAAPGPTEAAADGEPSAAAAGPLSGVLPPHLAHVYVVSPSEHRTDRVRRLVHALGLERALLFVPKQSQAMVTKYKLEARNMAVSILHGRLSRLERGNILEAFRRGVFRLLVVTDLGARGLDLPDCDAAINFGPPPDALTYAHRAGRAGRAGAPGVVVSVVTGRELRGLTAIARKLGVHLQALSVSHGTIAPGEVLPAEGAASRGGRLNGSGFADGVTD